MVGPTRHQIDGKPYIVKWTHYSASKCPGIGKMGAQEWTPYLWPRVKCQSIPDRGVKWRAEHRWSSILRLCERLMSSKRLSSSATTEWLPSRPPACQVSVTLYVTGSVRQTVVTDCLKNQHALSIHTKEKKEYKWNISILSHSCNLRDGNSYRLPRPLLPAKETNFKTCTLQYRSVYN